MTEPLAFGIILCGGAGVRLGGRKAMTLLAGRPMSAHVADRLRPDVAMLAMGGDAEAAAAVGVENVADPVGVARGPLAGVLAGLEWASAQGAEWIVTAPCDTPLLPVGTAAQLLAGAQGAEAGFAETGDGPHPLVCAWRTRIAARLRTVLVSAHPPVWRFLEDLGAKKVWFDDAAGFMNVNSPGDLLQAQQRVGHG